MRTNTLLWVTRFSGAATPVSKSAKDRSHKRIVASAARMARERGVEGASVADVMGDAGLTHGGFYRHFETKEALLDAAVQAAFDQVIEYLDGSSPGDGFRALYLSEGHVDNPGIGCPVATIGSEIARGSDAMKRTFGAGARRMLDALAKGVGGAPEERSAAATRELAMLVGAVVIARASDPETARAVLSACRSAPAPR